MTCSNKSSKKGIEKNSKTTDEETVSAFMTALQPQPQDAPPKQGTAFNPSISAKDEPSLITVSAQILRHALIGQAQKVADSLSPVQPGTLLPLAERMLKLDRALCELAIYDPVKARMVELCYFAGMSKTDAADVLGWSADRFQKEWLFTKAWIKRHIDK